jgi:hypothetical protein
MKNKCLGVAKIVFSDTGKTKHHQVEDNREIIGYYEEENI